MSKRVEELAMGLLPDGERVVAEQLAALAFTNPFLPERMEGERRVLGSRFASQGLVWSHHVDGIDDSPNFRALVEMSQPLAERMQAALRHGTRATKPELRLYEDLVSFLLYYQFRDDLSAAMRGGSQRRELARFWKRYRQRFAEFFEIPGQTFSEHLQAAHLFALGFQLRRAFEHTFYYIIGRSLAAAQLRAAVWQSLFTHDMQRYNRGFYRKLGDYVTLVMGPSGTGKELVARAIGLSQYIPFDEEKLGFVQDFKSSFLSVNLSALSPTLIESELFGHRQGAFTGATTDRVGWLESCPQHGTVFLDEIGELDGQIQVKLLRVFQDRTFQRLGETTDRRFAGKIIAATHRDLAQQIRNERFRHDFYYRICSDVIRAPGLRERIREEPDELADLVRFLVRREGVGEVEELTDEVLQWIGQNLGPEYTWPGNIRELEQCVRNVLIRQHYRPLDLSSEVAVDPMSQLALATENVTLSVDQLLGRYCTLAYARYGSYEAAAAQLKMDRRTLRKRVDTT